MRSNSPPAPCRPYRCDDCGLVRARCSCWVPFDVPDEDEAHDGRRDEDGGSVSRAGFVRYRRVTGLAS